MEADAVLVVPDEVEVVEEQPGRQQHAADLRPGEERGRVGDRGAEGEHAAAVDGHPHRCREQEPRRLDLFGPDRADQLGRVHGRDGEVRQAERHAVHGVAAAVGEGEDAHAEVGAELTTVRTERALEMRPGDVRHPRPAPCWRRC